MAPPKGNTYAVGNNGGRPMKYDNVKDLQDGIDRYYKECDETVVETRYDKDGNKYDIKGVPYTIEGLCHVLEIDRDTLVNYGKRNMFFGTVRTAKSKVLRKLQEYSLIGKYNPSISIFNLKNNYGYVDKTEIDQNTKIQINPEDYKNMSVQELQDDISK